MQQEVPGTTRLALVERNDPELPLSLQARLLGVSRSSLYYQPVPPRAEEIALKHRIDEIYTQYPYYGSRRITAQLRRDGWQINRKAVQQDNQIYPYLLSGLAISRPNQVWGIDITYVRLHQGWMYLVAILDWYASYVVSWLRHEVAFVAVGTDKTVPNPVFHHRYFTETCVGSNPGVRSSRNNVPSLR
jgi:putative transposase